MNIDNKYVTGKKKVQFWPVIYLMKCLLNIGRLNMPIVEKLGIKPGGTDLTHIE